MRALMPLLVLGLGWTSSVVAQNDADDTRRVYEQGVVGLQVTYQRWDEDRPWTKQHYRRTKQNWNYYSP